jgi:hypothetical protein
VKAPTLHFALLAVFPLAAGSAALADTGKKPTREVISFGELRATESDRARSQALAWLQTTGKANAATLKAFEAIWAEKDRPVLDRVADSLALGDAGAARLLEEARDFSAPAPTQVPAILKDAGKPVFLRANLALAYARALSQRRVYEESLAALKAAQPEQVVDPGAYLFHRAVAEHALLLKEDASRSIVRLLDDAVDVPDRYKMVAVLMAYDMESWKQKDLGEIARKMDNIERRLELARGGPHTQKIEKEVVLRLDELIKQLENESNGSSGQNSGNCPNGGNSGGANPNSPLKDSRIVRNTGPGRVDPKHLEYLAQNWGKLPEKERAQAMQDLTRDMPPKYREVFESYFRKLATVESSRP